VISGEELAFLRARLDEDEATARGAAGLTENWVADHPSVGVVLVDGEPLIECHIGGLAGHVARNDPGRILRGVETWRRLLLEYSASGLDAKYAGTERETGYQIALSVALRAKAYEYREHPAYAAAAEASNALSEVR